MRICRKRTDQRVLTKQGIIQNHWGASERTKKALRTVKGHLVW